MGVGPRPFKELCFEEIRNRLLELEETEVELILEGNTIIIGTIPEGGVSAATVQLVEVRGNEIECTVSICCICAVCTVPPEAKTPITTDTFIGN